jgi:hypothetical protein
MIQAGELFEYGIHTEQSDVRAHVSVCNRTIYVFQTRNGVAAVEKHQPPLVTAGQPGVIGPTADGWLVKLEWIKDLRARRFDTWAGWGKFDQRLSTSRKGRLAVECVIAIMRLGYFPFWLDASEDDRENVQIKGTDILVFCKKRVQVKCDYMAGKTGNIFLQHAERNPLKMI